MQNEAIWNFVVEVQGRTFYSKEVRKVMIKVYQPVTFVQTDKPIYLPGQAGNIQLIACAQCNIWVCSERWQTFHS